MEQIIMAFMGEMSLKGLNRGTFETALRKGLRNKLAPYGEWKIFTTQSTIYITPIDEAAKLNIDDVYAKVLQTFGIATASKAAVCEKNFEAICRTAQEYLQGSLAAAATFKVAAKRADKTFPLNSMDIAREVGAYLLQHNHHLHVDVKKPDLQVVVEVREQSAYIHAGKQRAAGGLPIPTSGRAAVLLSGGIDSPVAAWQMAKRGLGLVAVHFASPPYTSPRASAKVEALADILTDWTGPLPFYLVGYTKVQEYLRDKLPKQDYFTVMMRRSMMRITAMLAEKEGCEALVTGESLAQVASQTLSAIACTDAVQDLPVFRPCIGMDKTEIIDIARAIGTYETSIQPFEDCCTIFTPPHPRTRPRMQDVLRGEAAMPDLLQLEREAAENAAFSIRK